jgi:hypothetical protein
MTVSIDRRYQSNRRLRWALQLATIASSASMIYCDHLQAQTQDVVADSSAVRLASSSATRSSSRMAAWPVRLQSGQFRFYSTLPPGVLERDLARIQSLPDEIATVLGVEKTTESIHVVILRSKEEYERYLQDNYPSVPTRRALYIRDRGPGLVLTYHHAHWITDARHECTHAILHSGNANLPLWLDEGLAEYFETSSEDRTAHPVHLNAVRAQLRFGQVPEIEQLELVPSTVNMSGSEYRDAWAMVTFLLHRSDASKQLLQSYVQDLLKQRTAGLLRHRISESIPQWREEYVAWFKKTK